MGLVYVRDLRVRAVIGIGERERSAPQDVLVGLDLEADLEPAAGSDDLGRAVDYASLVDLVRGRAEEARFHLLEALAGALAALVLERFPRVRAVTVRLEKPGAVPGARVGVELRRER